MINYKNEITSDSHHHYVSLDSLTNIEHLTEDEFHFESCTLYSTQEFNNKSSIKYFPKSQQRIRIEKEKNFIEDS